MTLNVYAYGTYSYHCYIHRNSVKVPTDPSTVFTLCCRVFKKSAPNNKLTLYLSSRDLFVSLDKIDRLQGVLLVDPDYLQDRKVSTVLPTEQH